VVIVGPTAVGKSALALALAERFQAAILTADSRQVYRYMDIGTAKPSREEQARVPHYMLDLVEPSEVYSAGRFALEGQRVLDRLEEENRISLVVGGTGFYIRALLQGLSLPPVAANPEYRSTLLEEAKVRGADALHKRLAELDPASAARIHPSNVPRVVRALEIIDALGGPVPVPGPAPDRRPALYLGLTMDRSELRRVVDRRVLGQMDAGLLEETRLLLSMGYDPASPALDGFGYRQMIAYLRGEHGLDEAVRSYQTATHQYVRRQMTWFRSDPRIRWLPAGPDLRQRATSVISDWIAAESRNRPS
jgi:tRNA dimethylallyltransferase